MSRSTATIRVERTGPVTTILLDRPAVRNALDRTSSQALAQAFDEFEKDAESRVAVLTGAGESFCAGADLQELAVGELYEPWGDSYHGPTRRVLAKPVIAAVEGHACGGGLGLALWCDLRIAAEDAVFGVFSRRWGVPVSDGTTVRLPRIVGLGRALDMLLTGRAVGAQEALAMGLVSRVVPRGRARGEAEAAALEIAAHPQAALLCDRRSAYAQLDLGVPEALHREAVASREIREREARRGASRFAAGEGRHGEAPEPDDA